MDGLIALSIGLPSTAAIITGGALWMQSIKGRSNSKYVMKEIHDIQICSLDGKLGEMKVEFRDNITRLEMKIDKIGLDVHHLRTRR